MKHTFLIANLDKTFIDGEASDKAELYALVGKSAGIRLVYMSDSNLSTVEQVMWQHQVPSPDYIICDGGATLIEGLNLTPIPFLQARCPMTASVNKGLALRRLLFYLGADPKRVIVVGHGIRDLSLYQPGCSGVVVGGGEPALLEALAGVPVFRAAAAGAGGVLEALRHLGY